MVSELENYDQSLLYPKEVLKPPQLQMQYTMTISMLFYFQYALHSKKENAHEESIWTCAWGRLSLTEDKSEKENENENNGGVAGDEIKEDNVTTVDIIATGGVDDLVKVWEYTPDGEMKLKHKLSDHSLGVVSVDLSKDVKSKFRLLVKTTA